MPDASPISVAVTFDGVHAASGVIGPEGGTVTATDSAGVTFTLTIPPAALPNTTALRMTPVTSFEGLPFTASAAIAIEPSGLQLEQVGTLEIANASAAAAAFTFHGAGNDVARWIHFDDAGIATLPVLGLAGFGLSDDLGSVPAEWRPGDPATRAIHDLAPAFYATAATPREIASVGLALAAAATDSEAVVNTLCQAAAARHERATQSMGRALDDPLGAGTIVVRELLAAAQLSGQVGCDPELEQDFAAIGDILVAAARELSRRCETRSHDPARTLMRAVSLVRQAQILALPSDRMQELRGALSGVRSCTQYRLFIDSTSALAVTFHEYVTDGDTFLVEGTVVTGRNELPLTATVADTSVRWQARLTLQIRSEQWDHDCWTGAPFRLLGPPPADNPNASEGPAVLDARAEPLLGYQRIVDVNGVATVPDESSELIVTLRMSAYALMPARNDSACQGLNPLLWDVGGSFFGAGGSVPFRISIAGGDYPQQSEGRAFITPPGTTEPLDAGHHAALDAMQHFTSDTNGAGFDIADLFVTP